jgi:hypothetical protein
MKMRNTSDRPLNLGAIGLVGPGDERLGIVQPGAVVEIRDEQCVRREAVSGNRRARPSIANDLAPALLPDGADEQRRYDTLSWHDTPTAKRIAAEVAAANAAENKAIDGEFVGVRTCEPKRIEPANPALLAAPSFVYKPASQINAEKIAELEAKLAALAPDGGKAS